MVRGQVGKCVGREGTDVLHATVRLKSEHILGKRKVRRSARASVSSSPSRRAHGERQKKQEADTRAERRAGDDQKRESGRRAFDEGVVSRGDKSSKQSLSLSGS